MRVVIDTNIIVSAVLKDRIPEAVVVWVVLQDGIEWLASPAILDEYVTVLRRPKFRLPPTLVERWDALFSEAITVLDVEPFLTFERDRKDAKFLECAHIGGADYLITGDGDFGEAGTLIDSVIISVSHFKAKVCDAR